MEPQSDGTTWQRYCPSPLPILSSKRTKGGGGLAQFFRKVLLVMLAGCVLVVCRWLAYQLRFDFEVPEEYQVQLKSHWYWVIPLQLGWLLLFRQFSGIYKYFSLPEVRCLAYAMTFSGLSLYGVRWLHLDFSPPRGVILVQCMLGFLALGALRSAWRQAYEMYFSRRNHRCFAERRVAIIGAGDAGASLVRDLKARSNLGRVPVAFFDDDRAKWGSRIHGIPVVGAPEQLARKKEKLGLEEVIIAMPAAPAKRLGELVSLLQTAHLQYVTVPSIDQLASGEVRISQLRPVKIEDLLGREPIDLRLNEIGGGFDESCGAGDRGGREHRQRALPAGGRLSSAPPVAPGAVRSAVVPDRAGTDQARPRQASSCP